MHYSHLLFTILLGISFASHAAAAPADRFAAVEITSQHVAGSIHMLQGAGGNIGVSVGVDGTLIVDDQYAPLADRIIAALQALGGDRPKLILNTHYHGDHTGSNPEMGTTGTIVAHDNVRARLLAQEDFPRSGLPLVTFDDDLNLHFNDETIEVIHLPAGHTDGDSIVWFKASNVIHMGDHFFKNRFPYIDIGSGGDVDGFIRNVESVLAQVPADVKVIPGHGSLSTHADLAATIAVVRSTAAAVRAALDNGTDTADIVADLNQNYPDWGSGFITADRWVQIVQADTTR
ncbi:MAG: MBL fold metallo-hydrolase [bacterium]